MNSKSGKYSITPRILILTILLVLFLIIGAILTSYGSLDLVPNGEQDKENAIKALNGEIIPFPVDMSKPFSVMLSANTSFQLSGTDLANGFDFNWLNITSDQFKIQFINGKLSVSANIRDSNGALIAQIAENIWGIRNPDTLLFWDRNYNAYAFEIIGSNNVPTLQVAMVGPNEIQIGGLFYSSKYGRIYFRQPVAGDPAGTGAVLVLGGHDDSPEWYEYLQSINIPRLFKYPALRTDNAENLGKMVSPIYSSSDPLSEANSKIQLGNILSILGAILMAIFGVGLPFVIAVIIRERKKAQTNKPITIHQNYYFKIKENRAKKKKSNKKKKR